MSCLFVITPVLTGIAWPVLASAITSALGIMGYSAVKGTVSVKEKVTEKTSIELNLKNATAISETLGVEEELVMSNGPIMVNFKRDVGGKCKICVSGERKSENELRQIGTEIGNKVVQSYVRQRVLTELKHHGFAVTEEKKSEDGVIRLAVRKWV